MMQPDDHSSCNDNSITDSHLREIIETEEQRQFVNMSSSMEDDSLSGIYTMGGMSYNGYPDMRTCQDNMHEVEKKVLTAYGLDDRSKGPPNKGGDWSQHVDHQQPQQQEKDQKQRKQQQLHRKQQQRDAQDIALAKPELDDPPKKPKSRGLFAGSYNKVMKRLRKLRPSDEDMDAEKPSGPEETASTTDNTQLSPATTAADSKPHEADTRTEQERFKSLRKPPADRGQFPLIQAADSTLTEESLIGTEATQPKSLSTSEDKREQPRKSPTMSTTGGIHRDQPALLEAIRVPTGLPGLEGEPPISPLTPEYGLAMLGSMLASPGSSPSAPVQPVVIPDYEDNASIVTMDLDDKTVHRPDIAIFSRGEAKKIDESASSQTDASSTRTETTKASHSEPEKASLSETSLPLPKLSLPGLHSKPYQQSRSAEEEWQYELSRTPSMDTDDLVSVVSMEKPWTNTVLVDPAEIAPSPTKSLPSTSKVVGEQENDQDSTSKVVGEQENDQDEYEGLSEPQSISQPTPQPDDLQIEIVGEEKHRCLTNVSNEMEKKEISRDEHEAQSEPLYIAADKAERHDEHGRETEPHGVRQETASPVDSLGDERLGEQASEEEDGGEEDDVVFPLPTDENLRSPVVSRTLMEERQLSAPPASPSSSVAPSDDSLSDIIQASAALVDGALDFDDYSVAPSVVSSPEPASPATLNSASSNVKEPAETYSGKTLPAVAHLEAPGPDGPSDEASVVSKVGEMPNLKSSADERRYYQVIASLGGESDSVSDLYTTSEGNSLTDLSGGYRTGMLQKLYGMEGPKKLEAVESATQSGKDDKSDVVTASDTSSVKTPFAGAYASISRRFRLLREQGAKSLSSPPDVALKPTSSALNDEGSSLEELSPKPKATEHADYGQKSDPPRSGPPSLILLPDETTDPPIPKDKDSLKKAKKADPQGECGCSPMRSLIYLLLIIFWVSVSVAVGSLIVYVRSEGDDPTVLEEEENQNQNGLIKTPVSPELVSTTRSPVFEPTVSPAQLELVEISTAVPSFSGAPAAQPIMGTTSIPTIPPTGYPTPRPTFKPTLRGTQPPTNTPTLRPSLRPTQKPTSEPTQAPAVTDKPTDQPAATLQPTVQPVTTQPTDQPVVTTHGPTGLPSLMPVAGKTLRELILEGSPWTEASLDDPNSSQSRAVNWLEAHAFYNQFEDWRMVQLWAIAAFAYNTNVESWTESTNWLANDLTHECNWFGVRCNDARRIITIDLQNNGLQGQFLTEMFLLWDLAVLNLAVNQMSGQLPPTVGLLRKLELFRLDSNDFEGPIPAEAGGMERLEKWYFERNNFSGQIPATLSQLVSIEELIFYANEFTGIVPNEICELPDLSIVEVDCREVECECWTTCWYQCGGDTGIECPSE